MNATTQIISILSAMGAKPFATPGTNGETLIKVNAPTIKKEDRK